MLSLTLFSYIKNLHEQAGPDKKSVLVFRKRPFTMKRALVSNVYGSIFINKQNEDALLAF